MCPKEQEPGLGLEFDPRGVFADPEMGSVQ